MNVNKFEFNEKICLLINRYDIIMTFFPTKRQELIGNFSANYIQGTYVYLMLCTEVRDFFTIILYFVTYQEWSCRDSD